MVFLFAKLSVNGWIERVMDDTSVFFSVKNGVQDKTVEKKEYKEYQNESRRTVIGI